MATDETSRQAPGSRQAQGSRQALGTSLAIMSEYHWMFLRHLHAGVSGRFGAAGREVLARGLHRYGYYRGVSVRDDPEVIAAGRPATALVTHWDAAELALAGTHGPVRVTAADGSLTVSLPFAPGADYFAAHSPDDLAGLDLHWRHVLAGMAEGFGAANTGAANTGAATAGDPVTVSCDPAGARPWAITWSHPDFTAGQPPVLDDVLASPARYIALGRRSTGLIAALEMYPAMALLDAFDASGEETVREAAFAFGAERGAALRQRHLDAGIPVDLAHMSQTLGERDPLEALFSIRGPAYASAGISQFDCTYCPLADIWAAEGSEGLRLGYLYDMELHRGLVETYHPGAVVRWDALKTRGDAVCRFRFSIPELVTPEERPLLEPASRRPDPS